MIPGLDVDGATLDRIESEFASWADHFRDRLYGRGIGGLLEKYEEVVRSIETQSCDHGDGLNTGDEWRWCCGVSYEYANDISVRDALDTIVEILGGKAPRECVTRLMRLDDRLYALYQHQPPRIGQWWRVGLPAGVEE
ncbi:MAG: hypothetical protein WD468_02105 [Pirellulales bacterium]